jgi:murein DD-endopeptidase MepM/ murein hydrolase activator NlpD
MKFAILALAGLFAALPGHLEACDTGNRLRHPAQGEIYGKFGYREHPLLHVLRLHTGLDYRGAIGDPVAAAEGGTVAVADREGGYGNYVRIDHGNGLQTAYAHLASYNVKPGQCVSKDELIGSVGNSGVSTEPHLHFEVLQNSRFIDPISLLPGHP